MSTDEGVHLEKAREPGQGASPPDDVAPAGEREPATPRWWHRAHPVFTPLAGFFTGVALVVVALAALGFVLQEVFDYDVTAHPWVLLLAVAVVIVVNVALLVRPASRRFARYMLFGVLVTPVVVFGVGALTTYLLIRNDG